MKQRSIYYILCLFAGASVAVPPSDSCAQQKLRLTFDEAVNIAFDRSYEVRQRRIEYQRNMLNNQASRASLKSNSRLSLELPSATKNIDLKFDSKTSSYKPVESERTYFRTNWSVSQPVTFPFITNGDISLRTNIETLAQKGKARSYKDNIYIEFKQPLLTLNQLKNDIWRSDLNFERTELQSISNLLTHYGSLNTLYYEFYQKQKEVEIDSLIVDISYQAYQMALEQFYQGRIDSIEVVRLEVDYLYNKSKFLNKKVDVYKKELEFKQKFGLSFDQPIELIADLKVTKIDIDIEDALRKGLTDRPSIRQSEIQLMLEKDNIIRAGSSLGGRNKEISAALIAKYGFERSTKPDNRETFKSLFSDFDKYNLTKSLSLQLYLPLWDNGRKKYEIESAKLGYETQLMRYNNDILSRDNEIRSAARNFLAAQDGVLKQQENIERARQFYQQSLAKFQNKDITAQELSRTLEEYRNAQNLYLSTFIFYQTSWISFQQKTYWDWEKNISLKEKFKNFLKTN